MTSDDVFELCMHSKYSQTITISVGGQTATAEPENHCQLMGRRPFELQMACSADLPTSFSCIKAFDGAILFIKFESRTRSHDFREASEAVCTRRHSACNCPSASQIGPQQKTCAHKW